MGDVSIKVGDRVRVVGHEVAKWNGAVGVVVDPPERDAVGRYGVRLDGVPSRHGRHWFAADCLAPEAS